MVRVKSSQLDIAGNSFKQAYDLGKFSDTSVVVDDFVGNSDKADFFKLTINKSSFGIISLTGLQANADFELYNSKKKLLGREDNLGTKREFSSGNTPKGVYYLKVFPRGDGDTTYRLTVLTVTP